MKQDDAALIGFRSAKSYISRLENGVITPSPGYRRALGGAIAQSGTSPVDRPAQIDCPAFTLMRSPLMALNDGRIAVIEASQSFHNMGPQLHLAGGELGVGDSPGREGRKACMPGCRGRCLRGRHRVYRICLAGASGWAVALFPFGTDASLHRNAMAGALGHCPIEGPRPMTGSSRKMVALNASIISRISRLEKAQVRPAICMNLFMPLHAR